MRQKQNMTKQQVLVSRLLGLSTENLEQEIRNEIEENPFLEEVIEDTSPAPQSEGDNDSEAAELLDPNNEYYTHSSYDYDDYRSAKNRSDDSDSPSFQQADEVSFQTALLEQLRLRPLTEKQMTIGAELIGNIDEAGYLSRNIGVIVDDLAIRRNLDTTEGEVEEVLKTVQTFDPAGVGARNLQECLSIQLHRKNDVSAESLAIAISVVDQHFDDFANKRYEKICKKMNIGENALQQAAEIIRTLNPKPYDGDNGTTAQTIIPDFYISRQGDQLSFAINERNLPKLRKDSSFIEHLRNEADRQSPSQRRETKEFIEQHTSDADIFISAVEQRYNTLATVMKSLLKHQRRYFISGDINDLKPLLQKDIANETGLDFSTISRVVNQKYVQTQHGVIPLKELFSTSMTKDDGSDVTTKAIKSQLKTIVDNEDKSAPRNDEELRELLQQKGFPMARRTVAKYREALGIPTARMRKEL